MKITLLVFFCVVSQVSGQLMFKYVSSRINGLRDIAGDVRTFSVFALALCMYAASVFCWVEALRYMQLSRLYMFIALGFILVPLGAHLLFKEDFGVYQILGSILIICGITLSNWSASGNG